MAIFRVEKNKNYTVMSNWHLRDKNLSLKAKGLLSFMLSLPDDWDYSLNGLVKVLKENETSINTTLKELKKFKYMNITKERNNKGMFTYIYNSYELPEVHSPMVDNPDVEVPALENQTQINTNKQNIKKINNKEYYGEYQNVFFTEEQYQKLTKEYPKDYQERIQRLDDYMQSTGKKYKDCLATIRMWARKENKNMTKSKNSIEKSELLERYLEEERK